MLTFKKYIYNGTILTVNYQKISKKITIGS